MTYTKWLPPVDLLEGEKKVSTEQTLKVTSESVHKEITTMWFLVAVQTALRANFLCHLTCRLGLLKRAEPRAVACAASQGSVPRQETLAEWLCNAETVPEARQLAAVPQRPPAPRPGSCPLTQRLLYGKSPPRPPQPTHLPSFRKEFKEVDSGTW